MNISKLNAEILVLTTLLEGQLERALGMASFALVQTDDETAENYVQRIKDEALDRLVLAHNEQANIAEDVRVEAAMASAVDLSDHGPTELPASHPALLSPETVEEMMDEDMGPDDREQAKRDAEDELLF